MLSIDKAHRTWDNVTNLVKKINGGKAGKYPLKSLKLNTINQTQFRC